MPHDIEQAKRFLTLLDEGAEKFTFQTFDDKEENKNPALATWIHGDIDSLFNVLVNYNKLNAGVFVMVQGGDGSGRNIKAVNKIRCVFNENDHGMPKHQPLEPQIIVETSPGRSQHYFLCDGLSTDDFKPIQARLIAEYGSDPNAADLPRVLRLPGFYHNKTDVPHFVKIIHESGAQSYTKDQIITAFPPYFKPQKPAPEESTILTDKLSLDLRSALGVLRADDYSQWVNIGLALSSLGDPGRGLWLEWSSQYAGYDFAESCNKWESFKPDNIGYKSVFSLAQQAGWVNTAKKSEQLAVIDVEPEWLSGDDLGDNAKAPEFLINNILETNSNGLLCGSSQAFKTFCVLKMAHSVCTGNSFFGHSVFTTGKVLYICGEGKGALARRIKALKIVEGGFAGKLFVLDKPLGIDDIKCMDWLRESIEKIKPIFVVFDTFSSLASATNENDNSEVARALRLVSLACGKEGLCSIVIHHYGKDSSRGSRGAYAFHGNVDFDFGMERVADTMNTVLSCKKMKDGELFKDINLVAKIIELGLIRQDGEQSTSLVLEGSADNSLSKNQQIALDAIKDAIIADGIDLDDGRCCLNDELIRKCLSNAFKDSSNRFKAFNVQLPKLLEKNIVKTCGNYFWL